MRHPPLISYPSRKASVYMNGSDDDETLGGIQEILSSSSWKTLLNSRANVIVNVICVGGHRLYMVHPRQGPGGVMGKGSIIVYNASNGFHTFHAF